MAIWYIIVISWRIIIRRWLRIRRSWNRGCWGIGIVSRIRWGIRVGWGIIFLIIIMAAVIYLATIIIQAQVEGICSNMTIPTTTPTRKTSSTTLLLTTSKTPTASSPKSRNSPSRYIPNPSHPQTNSTKNSIPKSWESSKEIINLWSSCLGWSLRLNKNCHNLLLRIKCLRNRNIWLLLKSRLRFLRLRERLLLSRIRKNNQKIPTNNKKNNSTNFLHKHKLVSQCNPFPKTKNRPK